MVASRPNKFVGGDEEATAILRLMRQQLAAPATESAWSADAEASLLEAARTPATHKPGVPFQGPSGRWFVVNDKGRVVPAKNPNAQAPVPKEKKAKAEPEAKAAPKPAAVKVKAAADKVAKINAAVTETKAKLKTLAAELKAAKADVAKVKAAAKAEAAKPKTARKPKAAPKAAPPEVVARAKELAAAANDPANFRDPSKLPAAKDADDLVASLKGVPDLAPVAAALGIAKPEKTRAKLLKQIHSKVTEASRAHESIQV